MNGSISANADDGVELGRISGPFHPEDGAVQKDVLPPRQLRVKTGSNFEQRADAPAQLHLPGRWFGHARQDLQQGALACPVRTDQAECGSARHIERHVPKRPERADPASPGRGSCGGGARTPSDTLRGVSRYPSRRTPRRYCFPTAIRRMAAPSTRSDHIGEGSFHAAEVEGAGRGEQRSRRAPTSPGWRPARGCRAAPSGTRRRRRPSG